MESLILFLGIFCADEDVAFVLNISGFKQTISMSLFLEKTPPLLSLSVVHF